MSIETAFLCLVVGAAALFSVTLITASIIDARSRTDGRG